MLRRVGALLASCHPAPCVAVTVFSMVLAHIAGNASGTVVLVGAAVLAGQLSIGWSNDRIDAGRDAERGRRDKPVARGSVPPRLLDGSIGLALVATVLFSLALGWRAGLVHLFAVECGWLYNVWLKSTVWSWVPYAIAFGALPVVATLALAAHRLPGVWVVAAAASLGVAAHLANALPDLRDDRATGVHGFPHRIGARASIGLAGALLLGTTALIVFASPTRPDAVGWVGAGVVLASVLVGVPALWRARESALGFYAIMGLAAIDVLVLALNGSQLR